MDLDAMLKRLAELTPAAQERWDTKRRADDDDYDTESEQLWLEVQHDKRYNPPWEASYVYLPDESEMVAFRGQGNTPTEAAQALLVLMGEA